ncbi:erythroid membrane-associated protein isoform X2 [Amia ocellicauda]
MTDQMDQAPLKGKGCQEGSAGSGKCTAAQIFLFLWLATLLVLISGVVYYFVLITPQHRDPEKNISELMTEMITRLEKDKYQRRLLDRDLHLNVCERVTSLYSSLELEEEVPGLVWTWIRVSAVGVTLDPLTANAWLILSLDGKQVKIGNKQTVSDNPKRFDPVASVLGTQGFASGRHYWEVQVTDKTYWAVGVAKETVNRTGTKISTNSGYWAIRLRNGTEYKALASPSVDLHLKQKPQKVGVFVDYEEGQVSFYNVEKISHLYTFTDTFTEILYPFFNLYDKDKGKNTAPLIITPV